MKHLFGHAHQDTERYGFRTLIATKAGGTLLGTSPPPLPRAAVLVTGASSGIGFATAVRLARNGTVVFAGVRRQADADAVVLEGGDNVRPLFLDVTDAESIARARFAVGTARDVKLTALVNNAGIATGGPLEVLPMDELRRVFEVNFFAAIAMTQAFLPLLREHKGRVVNVTSIGGKMAAPFAGAYAASKFALEAASDALRVELRPFGISVSVVEPGAVKTQIWQRASDASLHVLDGIPQAARMAYDDLIRNMVRLSSRLEARGIPPERVAIAIERALTDARPHARYLVGADARLQLLIGRLPEPIRDRIVAAAVGAPRKPPREARRSAEARAVGV